MYDTNNDGLLTKNNKGKYDLQFTQYIVNNNVTCRLNGVSISAYDIYIYISIYIYIHRKYSCYHNL